MRLTTGISFGHALLTTSYGPETSTKCSLLTRRASQSLTGSKRGVSEPAKLASWRAPVRGAKRRAAAGRVSRVPFSFPSFFWASKRKKGAAAHPPLSNKVRAPTRASNSPSRSDTKKHPSRSDTGEFPSGIADPECVKSAPCLQLPESRCTSAPTSSTTG